MVLPTDIPDGPPKGQNRSYGGVLSADDAAADVPTYQAADAADAATTTPKTRRTGLAAAGISIAALALVVVGVVAGSRSNAAGISIDGTAGNNFNELMGATGTSASATKGKAGKGPSVAVDELTDATGTSASASKGKAGTGPSDVAAATTETVRATDYTDFNVIFVLVDDMGHNDMGYTSYDIPNATQTLNHFAQDGVRITNYYTQSSCTPARVALLTGRYPSAIGMGYDLAGAFTTSTPYGVPLDVTMVGRHFQNGGYRTAFIGKWNVGHFQEEYLPHRRGFESSIMYNSDAIHYYNHTSTPAVIDHLTDEWYSPVDMLEGVKDSPFTLSKDTLGTYTTELFTDRAVDEIGLTESDSRPLFLYLSYQSVHIPHDEPPPSLFNTDDEHKLEEVTDTHYRYHFGKTLVAMDNSIKKMMDHVEALGLSETTILAVTSDNGACPGDGGNNVPFRGGKFQSYEGGVHVPAFIWSGAMAHHLRGTTEDSLMHAVDWMPTLLSATGAATWDEMGELDGMDLSEPLLTGKAPSGGYRTEILLRMNKWEESSAPPYFYEHLKFNNSFMALITKSGDRVLKMMVNEAMSEVRLADASSSNYSCLSTNYNNAENFLFDVTADHKEEHNLWGTLAEERKNMTLRLQHHFDKANFTAFHMSEESITLAHWSKKDGYNGTGFVTPWHKANENMKILLSHGFLTSINYTVGHIYPVLEPPSVMSEDEGEETTMPAPEGAETPASPAPVEAQDSAPSVAALDEATCGACDGLSDKDCLSKLDQFYDEMSDKTKLSYLRDAYPDYDTGLNDKNCLTTLEAELASETDKTRLSLLKEACIAEETL